jgi:EAL domain-containing protein (putative c-di-GMP-specific phosphodiesterase class I)/FixJ family two-component response regulator
MNNKILVVDDEPKLLEALKRRLGKNFALTCATSGAQALALLDSDGPFAAVLSDVNMPGMSGIELIREMQRRAPETVRIILTGRHDFDVAMAAVNDGAVFRFHTKPAAEGVLEATLEEALLRHQLCRRAGPQAAPTAEFLRDVAEIRRALRNREFRLYLQPQRSLIDGTISGAEALIRWMHPERGLLGPGEFLGTAEAAGLMGAITTWVLETACAEIFRWRALGLPRMRIAVNITSGDLAEEGFAAEVREILERHDVAPDWLELELTEGTAVVEIERTCAALQDLAVLGVEVSIDDFGTGYSSFGWLKRLPVDRLKIDRSFITDIATSSDAFRFVETIVSLARDLGMAIVAEGIETTAQLDHATRAGCTVAQGYLLARPMPAGDFTTWLAERDVPFRPAHAETLSA